MNSSDTPMIPGSPTNPNGHTVEVLDDAIRYRRAGARVLPVPYMAKEPRIKGWPELLIDEADLPKHFPPGKPMNIGVLCGEPSGGLIDLDLDCPEAIVTAGHYLPLTQRVSGRASAPRSHRWYRVDVAPDTIQRADVDGQMILEVRSNGAQTIIPPSRHPDDEEIVWHSRGSATKVDAVELVEAANLAASAAIIARHWPVKGSRHYASSALAGGLLRAGWTEQQTEAFLLAVAHAANDEEGRKRVRNVLSAVKRLDEGKKKTGWTRLGELLTGDGAKVVSRVREWLGIHRNDPTTLPEKGRKSPPVKVRPVAPYKPFPIHALPEPLAEYVRQGAIALGADPSFVALPVLAAASSCIGNTRTLRLKRGWEEPPIIWAVIIGDSGTLKTPAYKLATSHLFRLQKKKLDEYRAELANHQMEMQDYKAACKRAKEEGEQSPERPEEPSLRRSITSDTTVEKLATMLEQNPRGILVARDELAGWLGSFTKYKGKSNASDLQNWLEMFNAGTVIVDRQAPDRPQQQTRIVPRASVCVTGGIQPGVLAQSITRDYMDSGLMARLLLASPPRKPKRWTEDEIAPDTEKAYHDILDKLLDLDFGAYEGEQIPVTLKLTPDAKQRWIEYYESWAKVQTDAEGEQAAAFSKIEAYAARLALVHHVVTHVSLGTEDCRPVTLRSIEAGIELALWFANEATRIYSTLSETVEERDARRLIEWIRTRGGRTTAKELQRSNSRKYHDSDSAVAALDALVDGGYGYWQDRPQGSKGGKPTKDFILLDKPNDDTDDTSPPDPDSPPETHPGPPDDTPDLAPEPCENSGEFEVSSVSSCSFSEREGKGKGEPANPAEGGYRRAPDGVSSCTYTLVSDSADLPAIAAAIEESALVGIDLETTGLDPRTDRIRLISLSVDTCDSGRCTYIIDPFKLNLSSLFEAMAETVLVGHNLAFDLAFLSRLGFTPGKVRDTMILSQILYASAHTKGVAPVRHGLKDCCARELGKELDKGLQVSDWSGQLTPEQLAYAAADVAILPALHETLTAKLAAANLTRTAELECAALPCIAWMASAGVPFDRQRWQTLADAAKTDVARLAAELNATAPRKPEGLFDGRWNWDSPEQVKEALALAGCPVKSTGDDVLAGIDHPIAKLLRDYRKARKRETTYGEEWASKHVRDDGRIYPKWAQIGANSGRMACGSPNMQSVKRGEYRKAFAAPPGRTFIKADYSQIELRIAAKISGDAALLAAYQRGEDLHTLTARTVLGITEVTRQHRQLAKAINFGLLYGMGARKFCVYAKANYGVSMTEAEAQGYREAFFRAYPGLRRWHQSVRDVPVDTRTLTGRRVRGVERFTEKLNLPVQGSGADGLKIALALLWERRAEVVDTFPVLAVHDEIVVECPTDRIAEAEAWLRRAMIDAMAPLIDPLPVEVEVKVGRTWGGD